MVMTECETPNVVKTLRPGMGQPCEDDSIDASDYQRKFIAAVEEGLAELDRGEFITHEELEREFDSWTFE